MFGSFGIAIINIALFEMAPRHFCLHVLAVLHMWKDDDQVDAHLKAFVAYLKAYVFSKYSDWQSMKSMTV